MDDVEEGGEPVDLVELARERRREIEAEPVDVALGDEVPQRVHDQPQHRRVHRVERVPRAGVVHVEARVVGHEPVVALVVDAAEAEHRTEMVALGGVVVDDVEDHLDPGAMQRLDHALELAHLIGRRRVQRMRREVADRRVAPVVRETAVVRESPRRRCGGSPWRIAASIDPRAQCTGRHSRLQDRRLIEDHRGDRLGPGRDADLVPAIGDLYGPSAQGGRWHLRRLDRLPALQARRDHELSHRGELGGAPAMVFMAKKSFDALPPAARKIFEENSGEAQSRRFGEYWMNLDDEVRKQFQNAPGHTIVHADAGADPRLAGKAAAGGRPMEHGRAVKGGAETLAAYRKLLAEVKAATLTVRANYGPTT